MMLEPLVLQNDCVALEPLTPDHAAGLERAAADGALWTLRVTYVPPPGAMRAYVEKALALRAAGAALPFAVRDRRDGTLVGTTRYYDFHPDVAWVFIGYTWYAASRQHTCVNTACKLLLVDHAFGALGCAAVRWETDLLNTRSQRAIERLGAHRDGVLRAHKRRHDGTLRDSVEYSIIAAEWPDLRARLAARLRP
ncbi:MAG TPA: GNAT family N-acetyltransferase [Rhodanobacteraceae bacterium]